MKQPHSLPDQDLKEYAETHLQYEFDMLTASAGILAYLAQQDNKDYLPWALSNALLNTFAMHGRNLVDFLYARSKGRDHPTDIIIQDYVEESYLNAHLPSISPLLDEVLTKANKQVAHLTIERINYEGSGKAWQFLEVARQIRRSLASISSSVPESRLSQALRAKLAAGGLSIPVVEITRTTAPDGTAIGVCFSVRQQSPSSAIASGQP
jgi:hypothetical protein